MSSFNHLPHEALANIASFLNLQDQCRLSEVNKASNAAVYAVGHVATMRLKFEFDGLLQSLASRRNFSPENVLDVFEGFLVSNYWKPTAAYQQHGTTGLFDRLKAVALQATPTFDQLMVDAKAKKDVKASYQSFMDKLRIDFCRIGVQILREGSEIALKAKTTKEGKESVKNSNSTVPMVQKINGDRVLHFTTAKDAIIASDKLRISATSDQGCIFCIPARYADAISELPPSAVKNAFQIHNDLTYYLEFNLENSKSHESKNTWIDAKICKGQMELKIFNEVLELSRRDPRWYEWKGKARGGWAVVPGPYNWGKKV